MTHFPYLSSAWKKNCEEERLLGVSLTGIYDNRMMRGEDEAHDLAQVLTALRQEAVETNRTIASAIGIDPSAAITCVKPSGCGTLDTKIKTADGVVSFDEIFALCGKDPKTMQDGEWVTPPVDIFVYDMNNDKRRITNLYIKGYSPVFEIEDSDGNTYRFSSEHRLLTTSGWKRMRELTTDDEIVSFGSETDKTLHSSVSSQGEHRNEANEICKEDI
jgi:hypothetical protein